MSEQGENLNDSLKSDPIVSNNADDLNSIILELSEQLQEPLLKSSIRLIILISLVHNRQLSFSELSKITSSGKGSMSNHLEKLQEKGLIRTFNAFSLTGPRLMVQITENGIAVYKSYANLLRRIII
jgi:DNA-binding transcriptional ArsR family regulator